MLVVIRSHTIRVPMASSGGWFASDSLTAESFSGFFSLENGIRRHAADILSNLLPHSTWISRWSDLRRKCYSEHQANLSLLTWNSSILWGSASDMQVMQVPLSRSALFNIPNFTLEEFQNLARFYMIQVSKVLYSSPHQRKFALIRTLYFGDPAAAHSSCISMNTQKHVCMWLTRITLYCVSVLVISQSCLWPLS